MIILIPVPSHPSWHSCQLTILHFMLCNTQSSAQAHNTRGHKSTTTAAMELYGVGGYYYEEAPETKQLFEEYCCLSFIHNARGTARLAVTRPPRHMDTRKLTSSFFVLLKNEDERGRQESLHNSPGRSVSSFPATSSVSTSEPLFQSG